METCLPPGFRFHPTEEELVGYYLNRKINSLKIDLDVIIDIDLYKIEPWDIQGRCKTGYDEQKEWYFFSHKDRKYPTGTRTNRATAAGFWKATGRDKAVVSKNRIIGMRKTLVFYHGRAPNGRKTDWIMHEYRLQTSELGPPQEEGWVVCRAFKKPSPNPRQGFEAWNHAYGNINHIRPPNSFSETTTTTAHNDMINRHSNQSPCFHQSFGSEPDFTSISNQLIIELPQLDSPEPEEDTNYNLQNTEEGVITVPNMLTGKVSTTYYHHKSTNQPHFLHRVMFKTMLAICLIAFMTCNRTEAHIFWPHLLQFVYALIKMVLYI